MAILSIFHHSSRDNHTQLMAVPRCYHRCSMLLRLTPTAPPSRVPAGAIFIRENHGKSFTLWLFNIAMENAPFLDDFPIKTSIFK